MLPLKPYKFLIHAIAQQTDDKGNVVGESAISGANDEPFVAFGCDALAKFAADFPAQLAAAEATQQS